MKQWIELADIAITIILKGQEGDKDGEETDKDVEDKIEKMDSLAVTDRLLMEQQGKTVDKTIQYHHYYRYNWARRR